MLRVLFAMAVTPLILQLPYLIPPYGPFTLWWIKLELFIYYMVMVLFGSPVIWIFMRKRWLAWWQVCLGAISVAALFLVVWFATLTDYSFTDGLPMVLSTVLTATVAGLVFWLLAFWRNTRFHRATHS
ncbi:hypothetical protein [Dyella japonica]|uniref:Transmembrane protein n=1 Tax=Dyella japonica TaxID=231455 RepID=A0ABV2JXD5_9GAMM